jgi:hypothetical protein
MDFKEKYLKYKNKYLEAKKILNQKGGVLTIPENLKSLITQKEHKTLDISDSVDHFLSSNWPHDTPNNRDRRAIFQRYLPDIPDRSYNIINLRGNGTCFFEAIFLFIKMTNDVSVFESYEHLKQILIDTILGDTDLRTEYGEFFDEIIKGILDPNSPSIDLLMKKTCDILGIKICSINIIMRNTKIKGYVTKFNETGGNDLDCITLLVLEGHVYLVFPTNTDGSSSTDLRIELYNSIKHTD